MRKDARVVDESGWVRLSRIADARRQMLGLSQAAVHAAGGPSPAWQRKLRTEVGAPSVRHVPHLAALDRALGWSEGTALSVVRDDRSSWAPETLEQEDRDLIEGHLAARPELVRDEIHEFSAAVEMRLRAMPRERADVMMRRVWTLLRS